MISGVIGIILRNFDKKALKKMKKHSNIVQLCQSIDSEIFTKYLNDQHTIHLKRNSGLNLYL